MLALMLKNVTAEQLVAKHFDVDKQGKGAYLIFNNDDKIKGRTGDRMRSTAKIAENPQLDGIAEVLQVALSICKVLGLVSYAHENRVKVHDITT